MSKKKHPEHVNHERWLVSYADFITLLFAFFVVLFASGQSDKAKQKKIATAISAAFTQMAMFDPHSTTPAIGDNGSSSAGTPAPVEMPMATSAAAPPHAELSALAESGSAVITPAILQERVKQVVQKQLERGELKQNDVVLRPTVEGVTLSLQEGGFFDSGSAELRKAALPTLLAIAQMAPQTPIRVEGHTDNLPMHSAQYASNWELSSARASAITRFLLEHSMINPSQLSAAGYAEYHPVASNATADGRAKNRRVDIVFLSPTPSASAPPANVAQAASDTPAFGEAAIPSPRPAP
jgi:chemotaxis protein MotB